MNKIDGSSGLIALVLLLLFTFTYTEVAVTALPVTILVQPEEGSINASMVVSAVVTTRRDWTFNINWSYRVNASSENPMSFGSAVNRSATLKIIPNNTNANTLTAFAVDADGNTANATVTLCTNTSPERIKIRMNMSALRFLLPDLKINNEKDNEKVVQFEMSVINESTQDITELLKKYRNGNASLSLLADHDVRIKVNASDIRRLIAGSGNAVHGSITFIEDTVPFELVSQRDTDTIPPVLTVASPQEDQMLASHNVTLAVSANEPIARWYYRLNNGTNVSFVPPAVINASEGANQLLISATDLAGNRGYAFVNFSVDTIPPELTVASPQEDQMLASHNVTLAVSANEPIARWYYRLNNNNGTNVSFVPPAVINASEGANQILISATDLAGNRGYALVNFSVDTIPPVLTVTSPQEDQKLASHNVTLAVSANEPIARWYYRLNNNNGTNVSFVPPAVINASEGANQILISATDLAGNRGYALVNFSVDTIPPVLTVTSPQEDQKLASHNVTLAVSANEPIARWYYRLNNGTNVSFASPNGDEHTKTTLIAKKGENKLDVYADDRAGNTGKTTIFFVVMEPRIAIESSIQGTGSITIEKEMSSSTAGIESEEQVVGITGTGGNYSIISIDILSKPVNITNQNYPDYHHAEVISFTGNDFIITHELSASDTQSGVNVTFTEDTNVVKLQKQNTVNIKTTSNNPSISYNTRATDVFIGNKQTKVDLSTPTKKVSIHHSLEGNCTSRMRLTFEE